MSEESNIIEFRGEDGKLTPFTEVNGKLMVSLEAAGINPLVLMIDGGPITSYKGRKKQFTPVEYAIQWHRDEMKHFKHNEKAVTQHRKYIEWLQSWEAALFEERHRDSFTRALDVEAKGLKEDLKADVKKRMEGKGREQGAKDIR